MTKKTVIDDNRLTITKTTGWTTVGDIDYPYPNLSIQAANGKTLTLDLSGDKIEISGDADLSEAAKIFFNEVIACHLRSK